MTIKSVDKLNINYTFSPYVFKTEQIYSVNGIDYDGIFIYTTLTDYPQLDTSSGSSGGVIKK